MLLLIGSVLITALCLPQLPTDVLSSFGHSGVGKGFAVFTIVIMAPWAFVGFDVASFDTAHYKFPARQTKWVIALSIFIAGFVYTAMSAVSVTYILMAGEGFGLSATVAYPVGAVFALALFGFYIARWRKAR